MTDLGVDDEDALSPRMPHLDRLTLTSMPDELLVRILREASEGEIIRLMPTATQHFRPFWTSLRQSCRTLRRIADDPQVIFPLPETRWLLSSASAVDHLQRYPDWLGVTHAFSLRDGQGRAVPALRLKHIFFSMSGPWLYTGQVELELWRAAIRSLPDLMSVDITWSMTPLQYEQVSNIDFLAAVLTTINEPSAGADADLAIRTIFTGSMHEDEDKRHDVRLKIRLTRSALVDVQNSDDNSASACKSG